MRKVGLSIFPIILFLLIMLLIDIIGVNVYANFYIHYFSTNFIFPIYISILFFKMKYVRYIAFAIIFGYVLKLIPLSLNLYEVDVSFRTIFYIDLIDNSILVLFILLILFSLYMAKRKLTRIGYVFILIFSIFQIEYINHYILVDIIGIGSHAYYDLPGYIKFVTTTYRIVRDMYPYLLIYFLLFDKDCVESRR